MGYTNSPLVDYTKISPNKTVDRNHTIDTITIHCVVGQVTVERLGEIFSSPSRKASSNYGVGKDGKIGLYVEEKDRSWCSSNSKNDHRAITIEVASDTTHPYAVTDKALDALIELCADICKRNNIKELKWSINKSDRINHRNGCNMTVHRDFQNKSCPGQFLYDRHGYIANEVNKRINIHSSSNSNSSSSASSQIPTTYPIVSNEYIKIGQFHANNFTGVTIPLSGKFDSTTKKQAIRVLQHAMNMDYKAGLKVDGIWGNKSNLSLGNHFTRKGESQYMVSALIILLLLHGYPMPLSDNPAKFDATLEAVVKQYQKDNKLPVTGVADANTYKSLIF